MRHVLFSDAMTLGMNPFIGLHKVPGMDLLQILKDEWQTTAVLSTPPTQTSFVNEGLGLAAGRLGYWYWQCNGR